MIKLLKTIKQLLIVCMVGICFGVSADDVKEIDMYQDWGIQLVHMRVTAGGYMIEFRYKVVDPDKALILSSQKIADFPYLHSLKSRAKLSVPYGGTVGFLKSFRGFLKKGKNYTAMFSNEGKHMLSGDKVKIQIKDQLSPALTLQ